MSTTVSKCNCRRERQRRCQKLLYSAVIILLVLASIPTRGYAKPTTANWNVFPFSRVSLFKAVETTNVLGPANTRLLNIGNEITKPYVVLAAPTDTQEHYVEALPAVPAALLMVLVGFLCITLVRDRKLWLLALSGLFWAGNTGVYAVPQLAKHLYLRVHIAKHLTTKSIRFYPLKNSGRARCDIEGTKYIGLVNHLAGIPAPKDTSQFCRLNRPSNTFTEEKGKLQTVQFAIIRLSSFLNSALSRPALTTGPFIRFQPAFISNCLSRGPPLTA